MPRRASRYAAVLWRCEVCGVTLPHCWCQEPALCRACRGEGHWRDMPCTACAGTGLELFRYRDEEDE